MSTNDFIRIVEKESETKSFINFTVSGKIYALTKSELINAVKNLQYWHENNTATNFSSMLFKLMCKADDNNLQKFLKGFPNETIAYLLWYQGIDPEIYYKTYITDLGFWNEDGEYKEDLQVINKGEE